MSGEQVAAEDVDQERMARNATSLVEATVDSLGQARMPNPLSIRRVVTEILDVGPGAEGLWEEAGPATSSAPTPCGSAWAAIGKGLDLSDEALQDIGVVMMFHDVGYAYREAEPARGDEPAGRLRAAFERRVGRRPHGAAPARLP